MKQNNVCDFLGILCNDVIDHCNTDPCGVGGICINLSPGQLNQFNLPYTCITCTAGYTFEEGKCQEDGSWS